VELSDIRDLWDRGYYIVPKGILKSLCRNLGLEVLEDEENCEFYIDREEDGVEC